MREIVAQNDMESECLHLLKRDIKGNRDLEHFNSILSDEFLLHFVRGKKYNHEVAYKTVLNYIHVRKDKFPELFQTFKPSTTESLNSGIIHTLRHLNHGTTVFMWNFGAWDTNKYSATEMIKKCIFLLEELLTIKDADKNGIDAIIDLNNVAFSHARAMNPLNVKKIIDILWNSFPLKYKSVHIVNGVYLFRIVFKVIAPLLPKKLRDRLHVHGNDLKSLHKHFSPDILPKSLGGQLELHEAFQDKEVLENIYKKEEYYEKFIELLGTQAEK